MTAKKARRQRGKIGVVVAWRDGEDDISATIESAAQSAGLASRIIAVEDTSLAGPARTRHRGIEAATDCDVIAIIDAHMRFDGNCIQSLARHVRKTNGLACPMVHHNEACDFSGGHYAGGRIVYKARDGRQCNALSVKWSKDLEPGQRGAVIGACYVMPRELYMRIGQPLAALPGWGCDEEALSISAWLAGVTVEVTDDLAAHRYRARAPWPVTPQEHANCHASRMALIYATVTDHAQRSELEAWQRSWVAEGVPACKSPEAERWRKALLEMPRTWSRWRNEVCEPQEIDGVQDSAQPDKQPEPEPTTTTPRHSATRANYGANENRRVCKDCGSFASRVETSRRTGRLVIRHRICSDCGARRVTSEQMIA